MFIFEIVFIYANNLYDLKSSFLLNYVIIYLITKK